MLERKVNDYILIITNISHYYSFTTIFITNLLFLIRVKRLIFLQREERHWWEVLSLDCLFRPIVSQGGEEHVEERIELLIQRLAVPNLWLQPSTIPNDYIKDLPVWQYRPTEADNIVDLMDGKERNVECPVKGQLASSSCAVCLELYLSDSIICGLPCGHNYHKQCVHTWLYADNHHCPICRWPVYKQNHPRLQQ